MFPCCLPAIGSLLVFIQLLSLALVSGLDWKQSFNAFALCVLTEERVAAPGALLPHFWKHWLVEVSTCEPGQRREGRAEAGAAAAGVLWLQTAGGAA